MPGTIRVLVVDDSALMRHRLGAIINGDPRFEVVGSASNGKDGLAQLERLQPDVVTLDVWMPDMDGLETLGHIMRVRPTPVIMVSALTEAGAQTTLDALALGAVDYLTKPGAVTSDPAHPFSVELLDKLAIAAQVRRPQLVRHALLGARTSPPAAAHPLPLPMPPTAAARPPLAVAPRRNGAYPLVVIGSSTGGPQTLDHLFDDLCEEVPAAFLIVQHMPPLFTASLAARLDRHTAMHVREVEDGEQPAPGRAFVAPGGWHVTLGPDGPLHLDQSAPVHGVRPAVDRTLLSVAECWRGPCLAVILTGMGADGTAGARAVRAVGAEVLAQDEETSIIYGMPRSVAEAGLASAVLPLNRIGPAIRAWVRSGRLAGLGASAAAM